MSTLDFIEVLKAEVSEDVFSRLMEKLEPLIQQRIHNNSFGTKEAAAYIGCSPRQLQEMCKKGIIKHYRIGVDYKFRQVLLDEWIRKQEERNYTMKEDGEE